MKSPYRVSFWCLYDADADQKYFKKCTRDGSLAIFDTEAEAVSAKCLRDGHMRVDYVKMADFESALAKTAWLSDLLEECRLTAKHDGTELLSRINAAIGSAK